MEIQAKTSDRNLLLELSGDIDHHGARNALRAQQRMNLLDGGFLVCNVPPQAKRVLQAASVDRLVSIR